MNTPNLPAVASSAPPVFVPPADSDAVSRVRLHWKEFNTFGRRTVEAAWHCGKALAEVKESLPHGSWLPWLESEGIERHQAARLMSFSEHQMEQIVPFDSVDAALKALKSPHVSHNSGENEWYTPVDIIEAARTCMGGIDLDPASSDLAQDAVQARHWFTKEFDGLVQPWNGRVWMNPPYESKLIGSFVEKLLLSDGVTQACVLVNNATETQWAQALLKRAAAACFPASRVRFLDPEGNPGAPLQGQMVVGIGVDSAAFKSAFESFGTVVRGVPDANS